MAKLDKNTSLKQRYTFRDREETSELIKVSREQFKKARDLLYNEETQDLSELEREIKSYYHVFSRYQEMCGGVVEDRYLYLTLYHQTGEGLARLAEKLGLPAK